MIRSRVFEWNDGFRVENGETSEEQSQGNAHHFVCVLKALQRGGLLDLVQLSEPDCEESYHDMIMENKRAYSQRWEDGSTIVHVL
jgi:hypothetical protein